MKKDITDPRIAAFDDHEGKVKYIIKFCKECDKDTVHSQSSKRVVPTCEHDFEETRTKEEVDFLAGRTDTLPPPPGANGISK